MSRTHLVLAAVFGLGLAGLGAVAVETPARAQPSADPPSLWSIVTSDGGEPRKPGLICAGAVIRQGLGRALPTANGLQCALIDRADAPPGVFIGRCRLGADVYGVHSVTSGDVSRDFTVSSVMQAESGAGKTFVSTQHYRQVLASCPAGWNDGDAGAPGDQSVVNAISGVTHPVSPPVETP